MKICVPLKVKTEKELLELFKKISKKDADLIEIWLDHLRLPNIPKILKTAPLPIVLVNRTRPNAEQFLAAIREKIAYIDLDEKTDLQIIHEIMQKKGKTKVILSYHNFEEMPQKKELISIIEKLFRKGADIAKIAVKIQKHEENLILFSLFNEFKKQKLIIHGMGEKGKVGRYFASLLGSEISYIALDERHQTASGQWTLKEWSKMWSRTK